MDINILVPYFMEDSLENIIEMSAVVEGQLKWIAEEGRTYWFRFNSRSFNDIENHWAKDDILFAASRELFNGIQPGVFSPDSEMTRGMFVTVLGRLSGVNAVDYTASYFEDVEAGLWYSPYVEWAVEAGIVRGYGNGLFGPNDRVTREQMALMIMEYAGYTGLELSNGNMTATFADADAVSKWAKDAVITIHESGIIKGNLNNYFAPKDKANRAEVAAVLKRFIENVLK